MDESVIFTRFLQKRALKVLVEGIKPFSMDESGFEPEAFPILVIEIINLYVPIESIANGTLYQV